MAPEPVPQLRTRAPERRARRQFGQDPDGVAVRDTGTLGHHRQ
jgi:hypothetical protein